MTLKELIHTRGILKGQFTQFKKCVDKYEADPNELQFEALKIRYATVRPHLERFESIQSEIESQSYEDLDVQLTERENFEADLALYTAKIQKILSTPNINVAIGNVNPNGTENIAITSIPGPPNLTEINYPKLELPKFSGNIEEWPSFEDAFRSAVENNKRFSNVQKLIYLRSCLTGTAAKKVQFLMTTDVNYEVAWQVLKRSYEDPIVIVMKHIEAFFNLPRCDSPTTSNLCEIADLALTHYRALEALKTPFLEAFPIYAVISKLDEETCLKWKELNVSGKLPSFEDLLEFLHVRQRVVNDKPTTKNSNNVHDRSSSNKTNKKNDHRGVNHNKNTTKHNSTSATFSARTTAYCHVCKGAHYTQTCDDLTKLTTDDRLKLIDKLKLCVNCLRANHDVSNCRAGACKNCKEKHHTLLHPSNLATQQSNMSCYTVSIPNRVLLSTALINFIDISGNSHQARVLLDSGSQANFISKKLANILQLPEKKVQIPVVGINDSTNTYTRELESMIKSRNSKLAVKLSFLVRNTFREILPDFEVNQIDLDMPTNVILADPQFYCPGEVDALLGAKIFYKLLCPKQKLLNNGKTVLQKTRLGWIVAGEVPVMTSNSPLMCNIGTENTNELLTHFWAIEEVSVTRARSKEEELCEEHYKMHATRDPSTGRYAVRLPFNEKMDDLGDTYENALKRFTALERSLDRDLARKKQYVDFLNEYKNLGHMSEREISRDLVFLPHHGIIKQSSLTTKLRVVFDASAKSSSGLSLNDVLRVGPVIQDDLVSIILRFRLHRYVITADIEKMYRQVNLNKHDRQYQNILWRNNKDLPMKCFQLNTVTYGTAPASFLATRTLQQLAEDEGAPYPAAARVLREDFYMDDLLTGTRGFEEIKSLRDALITITKKGCLPLRKWSSNCKELINDLDDNNDNAHVSLNMDDTVKTLGLYWNAREDIINYHIDSSQWSNLVTKRTILSTIAKLFDPLGLIGPVIIRAKLILQRLWQIGLGWDAVLPSDIQHDWLQFREDLEFLNSIKLQRNVTIDNYNTIELHGFGDASEKAYGACLYVKTIDNDGIPRVKLLCAKSKVAPLQTIQLPRLELCAALLLSKLLNVVKSALRVEFQDIYLWSDSTITLNWIRTPPNILKTFVANRVAEVQRLTPMATWRFVPSTENPADLISRGLTPREMVHNALWYDGPAWLTEKPENWPRNVVEIINVPEQKSTVSLKVKININEILTRYSSLKRLKRIMALVLRFVNNVRREKLIKHPDLTVDELNNATIFIIKSVQMERFSYEIKQLKCKKNIDGSLVSLAPFLDSTGTLRVGGRLSQADISFESMHQALLPRNHHVTNLIVLEYHEKTYHGGVQTTLNAIRDKYWILNGAQYVKGVLHTCVQCRRAKPIVPEYLMGSLPSGRVNFSRPFMHTGIDFCGPIYIKEKRIRNRGKIKVYIAVFVCFSTKAMHLELVEDLSSEAFLATLRRFFARRGKPSDIYTDNATNFAGAKHRLDEMYEQFRNSEIQRKISHSLADLNIQWHFIPPRSPHFGGLWEAAVKSVKRHLTYVASGTLLTYEALLTFIYEIEAIVNSRPLIPMSSDPNDLNVITPAHFLIGESLTSTPELNTSNTPTTRFPQWEQVQQMRRHYWRRWRNDYLHQLTVRKKWHLKHVPNLKVGDLVVVRESNIPPLQWPMARIIDVHPGIDGVVRTATVKTANGQYKRAVKGLSPLPINE